MNKEQVILNELNALGNFDTVQQEFNELQLEAIYNSMDAVEKSSDIHGVSDLPTIWESNAKAVEISEQVNPSLTEQEQAFFVSGFVECIKYLKSIK